jgi:hypothetical protein
MKRNRVVWSSSPEPVLMLPPRRPRRFRRAVRTALVLTVLALVHAAGRPRWRCALLGAALTIPGVLLRGDLVGDIMLLPGLMALAYAPFLPGETPESRKRHRRLRRELAAYSTPAERRDLEALLYSYSDGDTGELRAILASQDLSNPWYRFPGASDH